MATIRKRELQSGAVRYLVDYKDQAGKRRFKQFKRRKDAEAWMGTTLYEVQMGIHTPAAATVTVGEAGDRWVRQAGLDGLERSTIAVYKQHLKNHIKPEAAPA